MRGEYASTSETEGKEHLKSGEKTKISTWTGRWGGRGVFFAALCLCTVFFLPLLAGCGIPEDLLERIGAAKSGTVEGAAVPAATGEEQKEKPRKKWWEGFDILSKLNMENLKEYQDYLPETESLFRNESTFYYYYSILDPLEQEIYRALQALTVDPTSTDYRKKVYSPIAPDSDDFGRSVSRAYQAMIFDHPEYFWFRQSEGNFSYYFLIEPKDDGTYIVMFQLCEPYEHYREEVTAFNEAADAFLSELDLTLPQAQLAMDIHDRLLDLVTYDKALADRFVTQDDIYDYGYAAYGALVENSRGEAHTAVCDGYSYAYEYLLQQVGIQAMRIGGFAGETEDALIAHSWNLVCLDGEWYEVDPTWDDQEIDFDMNDPENDIFAMAAMDDVYWERLRHHLFNLTTEEMASFEPDDSHVYYSNYGYATFLGPSVHIRDTEETAKEGDLLSWKAPVATGTAYSYENLEGELPE